MKLFVDDFHDRVDIERGNGPWETVTESADLETVCGSKHFTEKFP